MLLIGTQAYAQTRTVTGTVTGKDDGLPLPGVSVMVKGSTTGTQTNSDGKYSIKVSGETVTLVFSYIGFTSKEQVVSGNTASVALDVNAKSLNEVVVTTSFGIQRDKKSLGYSTQTISAEQLQTGRTTNVTNALAGKVAGVAVNGSGGAFTGSSVIIRGFTTFTGSNQPLYVVDGIPIDNGGGGQALQTGASSSNRAIDINEDDIESLTVLKGAAATVLYGSRAASGVIQITTKKGNKNEKSHIEFTSSYGAGVVNRLPKYQNQYAQGSNGVLSVGGTTAGSGLSTSWGPIIDGRPITNAFGQATTLQAYPDNVKDIFKTATSLQNNISLTGGGDKTTYRVSYGNDYETYVIDNNTLKRNNLSVNARSEITPKLRLGTTFSYVNNQSRRTLQGNQLSNPLFRAYFTPRSYDLTNLPFEDALGNQQFFGGEDNPYWSIKHNTYSDQINRLFGSVNATYDLANWLVADLRVGTDYYNSKSTGYDDIGNRGGGFTGSTGTGIGGIIENQTNVRNLQEYFTLTATRKFGDFNVVGTIGNEINQNSSNSSQVIGYTLVVPNFNNLKNTITYQPTYSRTLTRLIGVYADFALDYKRYLTLNLKARNDWSSTLLPANRSIFYPAVASSFVLSDAFPSIKSKNVNLIKLRGAIGRVGKSPGAYNTDNYYVRAGSSDGFGPSITFPFNGSLAGYELSDGAGNPNLKPEFTLEYELGTEMAFFGNRLTIDGSVYQKKTTNVILSVPVSPSSGVTGLVQNAGKLSTKGVELLIGGTPIKTRNGFYNISVNFTSFKSTVDALAPGVSLITLGGFTTPNIRLVAGQEYGQIYGADYQRDASGNILIFANGLPQPTANVVNIGNPNPKWTMGITNNINYKGINFSFLLDIRKGGQQYSRNIADVQRNGVAIETAEFSRFQADGVTVAKPYVFPGVYASGVALAAGQVAGQPNTTAVSAQDYWGNNGKYIAATGYIYDTSWFRVREAGLSYDVPKKYLAKTPFGRASFGVYGRNLFLRAPNYPHFDPEQNALGISNAQGLEFNSLPNTRTIGINLKVTL
ncbi:SusC/RagA family TonB-linked outer membrane protein [Mucilaginibacter galii]|uniref:SusC/RagA family TonB-linked outer membrane protein n=1 Tax=Mucilaginibacter galii TaxID=2005073 RepID=A0A917J8Q6_9SPHI|nr:SusC/RagA family TonB-linked outer membrane protein [Mucilaginibacter galii]